MSIYTGFRLDTYSEHWHFKDTFRRRNPCLYFSTQKQPELKRMTGFVNSPIEYLISFC